MVCHLGLGLRHVEGHGSLKVAIAEHPKTALGIPPWGGGGG